MLCFYKLCAFCAILLIFKTSQAEICESLHVHTIYLQMGERGRIYFDEKIPREINDFPSCIEIVSCPFCHIELQLQNVTLYNQCTDYISENQTSTICSCGNATIWESSNNLKSLTICSPDDKVTYNSSSRSLIFIYTPFNNTKTFSLEYSSNKNQKFIYGDMNTTGVLLSPNFPLMYSKEYGIEQILICNDENCVISILFSDFFISSLSLMEFFDSDGQLLHVTSGSKARPPLITSSGHSLMIRFFGNGGTSLGYKATYEFKNESLINSVITDCGGVISDLGGFIYMDNLSGFYDCFWIIKPTGSLALLKTHLYVKVVNFTCQGELGIHEGITSESTIVDKINSNGTYVENIAPITKGFYITFKGLFQPSTKLLISYSAFSYSDCLTGLDYHCVNDRCIVQTLLCNVVDNCGDASDEFSDCPILELTNEDNRYWWPIRNNDDLKFNNVIGGIWMCGSFFICTVFFLIITMCKRNQSRPQNHINNASATEQIQTITQLLTVDEIIEQDDPPTYEPPPDYNQATKPLQRKKKKSIRKPKKDLPHKKENDLQINTKLTPLEENTHQTIPVCQNILSIIRSASDSSLPASLETGYAEEAMTSLTLSLETNNEQDSNCFPWLTKLPRRLGDSLTISQNSAASFDTLQSSQERVITMNQIIRCHSQDNIPLNYCDRNDVSYNQF